MNLALDKLGTPTARSLNVIVWIALVFMICVFVLLLGFAVVLLINNPMSADIMREFAENETLIAPTSRSVAISCLGGAVISATFILVLNLLRKIVGTLLRGDPFVSENISRARYIWIAVALAEILRIIIVSIASENGDIDIRAGTWFVVFVIAAFAEAFRHGAELRRDQELTV